jgi:hypothetical protein
MRKIFFSFFHCSVAEVSACWKHLFNLFKGHGNEADFLGILHKSVPHESLTLFLELLQFLLRIRGDIRKRKTTPRLAESGSRQDFLELPFFQTFK